MTPTPEEQARRDAVMRRVLEFVAGNRVVKLPEFDPERERPSDRFALVSVGLEENPFSGTLGAYRYQFEGEEDLLHLIVTGREPDAGVGPAEGRRVAAFVLRGLPLALVWSRQGEMSQHFYFGHDELPAHLEF